MHEIQIGFPLFLSLGDAVQERAFKSVSEHNELQFPFDKGKITNMHFTSRQLINLFTWVLCFLLLSWLFSLSTSFKLFNSLRCRISFWQLIVVSGMETWK